MRRRRPLRESTRFCTGGIKCLKLVVVGRVGCGRKEGRKKKDREKSEGLRCVDVPVVTFGFGFLHLNPGSRQTLLSRAILGSGLRRDLTRDKTRFSAKTATTGQDCNLARILSGWMT